MDEYISKKEALIAVTRDGCTANVVGVLYHLPTADVVPKSEVEKLKAIIADHKANEERWQELYADTVDKWEKAYEELEIKLENARAEVAREIFEEIEGSIAVHAFTSKSEDYANGMYDAIEWVDSKIAELKKKYTEEKE